MINRTLNSVARSLHNLSSWDVDKEWSGQTRIRRTSWSYRCPHVVEIVLAVIAYTRRLEWLGNPSVWARMLPYGSYE